MIMIMMSEHIDDVVEEVFIEEPTLLRIYREISVNNMDLDNSYIEDHPTELTAAYLMNAYSLLEGNLDDDLKVTSLKSMIDAISGVEIKGLYANESN